MKNNTYLLLLISAVLYALPFLFIHQLWWLVFVYPIPLLYAAMYNPMTFWHGAFWGVLAWGLHLSGVLYAIVNMAQGSWGYALIPAIGIVLYQAFFVGIIFWLTQSLIEYSRSFKIERELEIWTVALFAYTYWVDRWCLFVFGRVEGYQLMHPLMPLAKHPALLALLPVIGKAGLTALFFVVAATATYALARRTLFSVGLFGLSLLPWFASALLANPQQPEPEWVSKIVTMPTIFPTANDKQAMVRAAGNEFAHVVHQVPNTQLIVMPESSYYDDRLSDRREETQQFWADNHVGKNINVLVGAFRRDEEIFYNSIYWYKNGQLQSYFDKRHAMVLTEHIPSFLNFGMISDMYFRAYPQRCVGCNERTPLALLDEQSFVPYVCSELFFNERPDDNYQDMPIMFVSNDMWFDRPGARYVQDLMEVGAQFKAIQWQRDIVYTSASRMNFIGK